MALKSLKKQRRIQVIALATVALILSTALIGYGMRDGINFFRSPSQVVAEPPAPNEVFRIGGLVEEGSIIRGQGSSVSFRVTDGGATVPVVYTGVLPDLFPRTKGWWARGASSMACLKPLKFSRNMTRNTCLPRWSMH